MTPGLKLTTILYAGGLAVVSAAMLSFLPALKVTRARVQPHLANLGTGGATLRFGRVWTGAMIAQVALTAIAIPIAMETREPGDAEPEHSRRISQSGVSRRAHRAGTSRSRSEATPAFEERRAQHVRGARAAHRRRNLASSRSRSPIARRDHCCSIGAQHVEIVARRRVDVPIGFGTAAVGPEFFEVFDRPIVIGRAFHSGDRKSRSANGDRQ